MPLRIIAEGFGAEVIWVPETKGINITLGEKGSDIYANWLH